MGVIGVAVRMTGKLRKGFRRWPSPLPPPNNLLYPKITPMNQNHPTQHALGIDVGYSKTRRSTGLCLLTITPDTLRWQCLNTGTDQSQRLEDLRSLVPRGANLLGVGIDGPLTPGLRVVPHYRSSDALLTRGVFSKRGKPGATSAPSGQRLHRHATYLAKLVLQLQREGHFTLIPATHPNPVHKSRILEVFPNAFLSVLLPDAAFHRLRPKRNASDLFWEASMREGKRLENLIKSLAPGRRLGEPLGAVTDHDHRAALLCALAVLCADQNRCVLSGDPIDGDIILPPHEFWGEGPPDADQPWAEIALRKSIEAVRANPKNYPNHEKARVLRNGNPWL